MPDKLFQFKKKKKTERERERKKKKWKGSAVPINWMSISLNATFRSVHAMKNQANWLKKKKRRNEVEKINSCTRTSIFIIHTRGNVLAINPPFSVKQSSLIFLVMCLSVCVCCPFLSSFLFFFFSVVLPRTSST